MLDPDAKSLVFSTWSDVLDILASALLENGIQFAALQDQGKFKRNLEKFKVRGFAIFSNCIERYVILCLCGSRWKKDS